MVTNIWKLRHWRTGFAVSW